jgi:hypothetical protein
MVYSPGVSHAELPQGQVVMDVDYMVPPALRTLLGLPRHHPGPLRARSHQRVQRDREPERYPRHRGQSEMLFMGKSLVSRHLVNFDDIWSTNK